MSSCFGIKIHIYTSVCSLVLLVVVDSAALTVPAAALAAQGHIQVTQRHRKLILLSSKPAHSLKKLLCRFKLPFH